MNKKTTNILYWIAMLGLLAYFSYTKGWILANFESVSPKEASHLLQNDDNVTLLDVRTSSEFGQGHIEGARLIPVAVLNKEISKLKSVKDKKVIVYCQSGNRSVAASRILAAHGFVPLNMKGGFSAWRSEGLKVTK